MKVYEKAEMSAAKWGFELVGEMGVQWVVLLAACLAAC